MLGVPTTTSSEGDIEVKNEEKYTVCDNIRKSRERPMLKQHFRLNEKYFVPYFTIGTEIEFEQVISYNKGCDIEL